MMRAVLIALGLLAVVAVAAVAIGSATWRRGTAAAVAALDAPRLGGAGLPDVVSHEGFDTLPPPVARYLRRVLPEGTPYHRAVTVAQAGTFLVDAAKGTWGPFTATQHIRVRPAGFVWDARIRMGAVDAFVRDGFWGGHGTMQAAPLGLFTVVDQHATPDIDAGSLMRWLAEGAWLPTALHPASGVTWAPLTARSARAAITAGATRTELEVFFGDDGLITRVFSPARPMDRDGLAVPMPWEGRWTRWAELGEVLMPVEGEVAWLLPEGERVYWRGTVTRAVFR